MGKDGPRGINKTHSGIYKLKEKSGLNEEDPNATVLGPAHVVIANSLPSEQVVSRLVLHN